MTKAKSTKKARKPRAPAPTSLVTCERCGTTAEMTEKKFARHKESWACEYMKLVREHTSDLPSGMSWVTVRPATALRLARKIGAIGEVGSGVRDVYGRLEPSLYAPEWLVRLVELMQWTDQVDGDIETVGRYLAQCGEVQRDGFLVEVGLIRSSTTMPWREVRDAYRTIVRNFASTVMKDRPELVLE